MKVFDIELTRRPRKLHQKWYRENRAEYFANVDTFEICLLQTTGGLWIGIITTGKNMIQTRGRRTEKEAIAALEEMISTWCGIKNKMIGVSV